MKNQLKNKQSETKKKIACKLEKYIKVAGQMKHVAVVSNDTRRENKAHGGKNGLVWRWQKNNSHKSTEWAKSIE